MTGYRFAIHCPRCDATLRLTEADLGSQRACPRCHAVLHVPESAEAKRLAQQEEVKHEFSFLCKLCGTRLYGRPSQIGKTIACPDCDTPNVVSEPQKPAPRRMPLSDGDDYQLAPPEERPPANVMIEADEPSTQPAVVTPQVRLYCQYCDEVLYASVDQVGQQVECPDCHGKTRVPPPPPVKPKRSIPDGSDPDIQFSPTFDRVQEESRADELMTSAREHVISKEREGPDPPKHPFSPRVYAFPLHPVLAVFWAILSGMALLIAYLVIVSLESTGLGTIVGMFTWLMASFLGVATVMVAAVIGTNIITWAALGYQRILDWPPVEVFDWIRRTLFVFNAFLVSAAPGLLLGSAIPGGAWRAVFPAASAFMLFPIVMLSMVSEESPFVPLSRFIFASLGYVPGAWSAFYAHALVLLVLVSAPLAVGLLVNAKWLYVAVIASTYAFLVCFRLLGRLAYVIDDAMAGWGEPPDEDADEADEQSPEPPPVVVKDQSEV